MIDYDSITDCAMSSDLKKIKLRVKDGTEHVFEAQELYESVLFMHTFCWIISTQPKEIDEEVKLQAEFYGSARSQLEMSPLGWREVLRERTSKKPIKRVKNDDSIDSKLEYISKTLCYKRNRV